MIARYEELRDLALGLGLPRTEEGSAWGRPCVRAHGKMWAWWSPYVDAAVFHCEIPEREMLLEADPGRFTLHPHYANYPMILVRAGQIAPDWAARRLTARWEALAPKRWLSEWRRQAPPTGL